MASNTLNGFRAISVRLLIPWRGVWIADCELDLEDVSQAPLSGKATLVLGNATLIGTIDPRGSGTFGTKAHARVIGGGGGWDSVVQRQHFNRSTGTLSTSDVYTPTASLVGETINDPTPMVLGTDFVRTTGPASRIFEDRDWHVDLVGITQVAPWPSATLDVDATLVDFDNIQLRADLISPNVVLPNTTLVDSRLNGVSYTIREVEQTFDRSGNKVTAWCSTFQESRLSIALSNMVQELGGVKYLKTYRYRFVNAGSGSQLNLQAIDTDAPDLVPAAAWWAPGIAAKLTPSQSVTVAFLFGDARFPIVMGVDSTLPQEVTLDAQNMVHIASAGRNEQPVARAGDAVQVMFPPTMPITGTVNGAPLVGVITIINPGFGIITTGSSKALCG